jgi:hypothetical protein
MADQIKRGLEGDTSVLDFFRTELKRHQDSLPSRPMSKPRQTDDMVVNICGACGLEPHDE